MVLAQRKTNKVFSVQFVKRTNGELRNMTCRYGVTKYLAGGELKFTPEEKNLTVVFDMQKKDYRMISLDSLKLIKRNGKVYRVSKPRPKKEALTA